MMTVLQGDAYWDLPVCQFGLSIFWMNDHIRCSQISHRVDVTTDSFLQRESGNSKKISNLLVKTWLVNDEHGFWTQCPHLPKSGTLATQYWGPSILYEHVAPRVRQSDPVAGEGWNNTSLSKLLSLGWSSLLIPASLVEWHHRGFLM